MINLEKHYLFVLNDLKYQEMKALIQYEYAKKLREQFKIQFSWDSKNKIKPRGFALLSSDIRKNLGSKGGKIGGSVRYKKIGSKGMAQMGSLGGNKILEQKGRKHFVELSQKALKARGIEK